MSSNAELHLAYKVANAQLSAFPYPHFFVQNVFPADFYAALLANLPDPAAMVPLEQARGVKGYDERFVLGLHEADLAALPEARRKFWAETASWLVGARFGELVFDKFRALIQQRFSGASNLEFYDESLLVQDITNYRLGPHTDSPRKVVTLLFYLPGDESQAHLGTSLYLPKAPGFRCAGGAHHPREQFERIYTMPFLPNSLFAFLKTDVSFHGVEPVADPDCRRWLLLYDIYVRQLPVSTAAQPASVKFSF